jgi:hypothetical protein
MLVQSERMSESWRKGSWQEALEISPKRSTGAHWESSPDETMQ